MPSGCTKGKIPVLTISVPDETGGFPRFGRHLDAAAPLGIPEKKKPSGIAQSRDGACLFQ